MSLESQGISATLRGWIGSFEIETDFDAPGRGITAIFGPSGCGKTTVLRCIAGLERLPQARVTIRGEVWQEGAKYLPPHRRDVGYVFQEASLFTHLRVRGNLAFGQKRALARRGNRGDPPGRSRGIAWPRAAAGSLCCETLWR